MKQFEFKKIDAFATRQSEGNPAGYISLESFDEISEEEMQKIAIELKGFVNEVGYIAKEGEIYRLKYYASEREVAFCGHATIAIMYDILSQQTDGSHIKEVTIITNKGELTVYNSIIDEDAVYITAPNPVFRDADYTKQAVAKALHIHPDFIGDGIEIVNAGLDTLVVPILDLDVILSIAPKLIELKSFCNQIGIDIIEVFYESGEQADYAYRTRVFAPTFGYLEDPATGSGNAALGYYLLKHGRWDGAPISLAQNSQRLHFNVVKLKTLTNQSGDERVLFGGKGVIRISGKYHLHGYSVKGDDDV